MRVPKYQMYDELDHLGLYIFRNQYALNPSQYGGVKEVHWSGFRQEIDEYFNWLYTDPSNAHKPVQQIPELISEIVAYLDKDTSSEKIRLAHFLLDLCTDSKNEFADKM